MREWILRLALVCASPLVFLGLVELGARAAGVGYPGSFLLGGATNEMFGWRFFPRTIARTPAPFVVQGQRKVFVLGESAAMGFPDPAFGLAPHLQAALGGSWKVFNAAMTAINSHVIREIALECARQQPQVFVVYLGNNEVVGPFGAGTIFGKLSALPVIRAQVWLTRWHAGQWLLRPPEVADEWRGLEFFKDRLVRADDPRLSRVYNHLAANLRDIIRAGRGAGARVLIAPMAVNLRDCPPFAGEEAMAAYRRGEYAAARDLDQLRIRADSRVNKIIRQVTNQESAELVEPPISGTGPDFWEHVHLRPEGNRLLAEAFARRIGSAGAAELRVTAWDMARMTRDMRALVSRPPFTPAHLAAVGEVPAGDAREALAAWRDRVKRDGEDLIARERLAEVQAELRDYPGAAEQYRFLLGRIPLRGWHTGLGEALLNQGLFAEAERAYRAALDLDEQFAPALVGLGVTRAAQSDSAGAEKAFRAALRAQPRTAEASNSLGRLLQSQGKLDEAVQAYRQALASRPGLAVARYNLASVLARRQKESEAIDELRRAVKDDPTLADAHYDLGLLLARQGDLSGAVEQYAAALRTNPGHADAFNNWGTALARQGRRREAREKFAAALKANPRHAAAQRNLELLARP